MAAASVYSTVNGRKGKGSLSQKEGGAGKTRTCGREITASASSVPPLASFILDALPAEDCALLQPKKKKTLI